MVPVSLQDLDARLRKSVRGWSPALARSFRRYCSAWPRVMARPRGPGDPYWTVVPQDIVALRPGRGASARQFLEDVLFGQVCAFLAVRIHDDLFDGQCGDRPLIFAADQLLLTAREAFAPYFSPRSPFWPYLTSAISRTINAILTADDCGLHGYRSRGSVAAMIREGYAVCTIGAYAACLRARAAPMFGRIVRCTDEIAFAGKLLDDLEDMQEDRNRGRVNLAAYLLLGNRARSGMKGFQRMAGRAMLDGSIDLWYATLRRRLRRAALLATASGLPALTAQVGASLDAVAGSEALLHRRRVRLLFSGLRGKSRRRP